MPPDHGQVAVDREAMNIPKSQDQVIQTKSMKHVQFTIHAIFGRTVLVRQRSLAYRPEPFGWGKGGGFQSFFGNGLREAQERHAHSVSHGIPIGRHGLFSSQSLLRHDSRQIERHPVAQHRHVGEVLLVHLRLEGVDRNHHAGVD